ncbi:MAG: hypothetical protein ACYC9O_05450, partial [Candidatus Latescibacterota bacterium]
MRSNWRPVLLLCLFLKVTLSAGVATAAQSTTGLPPFIEVRENGGIDRTNSPVSGAIPLPEGSLYERDLNSLILLNSRGNPINAQFGTTGRWLDGSIKWLQLDFPDTQKANSREKYRLKLTGKTVQKVPLAKTKENSIEIDTGPLQAVFNQGNLSIRVRSDRGQWVGISDLGFISKIGIRQRGRTENTEY